MDNDLFLQRLHDLPLEEGRAYIREHIEELSDHEAIAKLLEDEALRVLYSPFLSLKLAELLIFYGDYVGHLSSHALGLKAKGDALEQIGHHQAAMDVLDAAGEEFLRLGDKGNWGRSRISWILACAWLGRVEEALREADRARTVFSELDDPYWVAAIDHNTAVIYEHIGRYQDAVKIYESMRLIYPTLIEQDQNSVKQRIALAEMNQAINLAWLGNFEKAYLLQEQAQASFSALEEIDLLVNAEVNLADLDYTQGYYGSALRRYYQARDWMQQNNLDDPTLLAEIKLCIANCLVKLNRSQEACRLANEAVDLYRQFGPSLSVGKALREYATTLVAAGRLKEALIIFDEAWELLNQGKFTSYAFVAKLQQAELLLKNDDTNEAYRQASFIKNYFETQGIVIYVVRGSLVIAEALIKKAQQAEIQQAKEQQTSYMQEAISLCNQVALQASQYNLQEEAYRVRHLLGRVYILQGNPTKAVRHYGIAISLIERILDDLVYDLSPAFLQSAWIVYEDMIALCLQQAQPELAFNYLEQARSMALRQYLNKSRKVPSASKDQDATSTNALQNNAIMLRTQYELRDEQEQYRYYSTLLTNIEPSVSSSVDQRVIEQELKHHEQRISELAERLNLYQSSKHSKAPKKARKINQVKQFDIQQVKQHLSLDQLLLTYFMYRDKLVIFAITRDRVLSYEIPDAIEQLERLLLPLLAHLNPKSWSDVQNPPQQVVRRLLARLYNLLIKPVEELLPYSSRRLTIVPYGSLHKLPFHALYDGSHYLIENFQVNYLPASSIMVHLEPSENKKSIIAIDVVKAVKPPLILGYSGNGHLQRIQDEATHIARLLKGQCYLEKDATIDRLIEHAAGSPIIHLATHGQSRLDAPNFSYIRLADGQLNAIDAFGLNLHGCELVTLSGCETGLALSGGGDEQLGLGRAFLAAGATSLVMSLWPVEDNATNELMQLFYENLLKGESKAQALRAAQCQLLYNTSAKFTHPYFWAAFRLVGDTGPLTSFSSEETIFTRKLIC